MKNRVKTMVSILCITLIVTLTGCNSIKKLEETKGFLWQATKGEITINLIGTMHPAPETHNLLNEKIVNTIQDSDTIWLEMDITNKKNLDILEKNYYLPPGKTVKDYLSNEYITKLENILNNYDITLDEVETYNASSLISIINNCIYEKIGFTGELSDSLIANIANKNNIKIKEIEGPYYQLEVLDKIYTWDVLKENIDDFKSEEKTIEEAKEEVNIIFENYVNGDVESANEFEDKMNKSYTDEMYNILIKDRNIRMVEKIDANMTDGKKHTLAVGYRHFMGQDSIIKLLESEGYTITRL